MNNIGHPRCWLMENFISLQLFLHYPFLNLSIYYLINLKNIVAMEGTRRADIKPGIEVMVELTEHKRTGRLTGGRVKEVLTSSPTHPHGIKVVLENGLVGRIKQII
jgi:uncharacterized repeat protein (TIGR03833 family)